MNRLYWLIGLFVIGISAGCNSDIVTTNHLKAFLTSVLISHHSKVRTRK